MAFVGGVDALISSLAGDHAASTVPVEPGTVLAEAQLVAQEAHAAALQRQEYEAAISGQRPNASPMCDETSARSGPARPWTTEMLNLNDYYLCIGITPKQASKSYVRRVVNHILLTEELSQELREKLQRIQETLLDKLLRQQYDALYGAASGRKPVGEALWQSIDGTIKPAAIAMGSPASSAKSPAGLATMKREAATEVAAAAKRNRFEGQAQLEDAEGKRFRHLCTFRRKVELLSMWEKFDYEMPDGRVINGEFSEEVLVTSYPYELCVGQLNRWKAACLKQRWPQWTDQELKAKVASRSIGAKYAFDVGQRGPQDRHPQALADKLGEAMEPHILGPKPPPPSAVKRSWKHLKDEANEEVKKEADVARDANRNLLVKVASGELELDDVEGQVVPVPAEVKGTAGMSWIYAWKADQGFKTSKKPRTSQKELPADDPAMVEQREDIKQTIEEEGILESLVANADQIWRTRCRLKHADVLGIKHSVRQRRAVADLVTITIEGGRRRRIHCKS